MTIDSEIIKSKRLVITTVKGLMKADELESSQWNLQKHPDFDPTFDHLFDMSSVVDIEDISAQNIKRIAHIRIFSPDSRRAVVAPDDLAYGFSRMYEVFSKATDSNFGIFRIMDDAINWLKEESS